MLAEFEQLKSTNPLSQCGVYSTWQWRHL